MLPLELTRAAQPRSAPRVNWRNPITAALRGLIWAGPGKAFDLVNPAVPTSSAQGSFYGTAHGFTRRVTTAQSAFDSGFSGVQARIAPWKVAAPPLTMLALCSIPGGGAATRSVAQCGSGGNGYQILDLYGLHYRYAALYTPTTSLINDGSLWAAGTHVRGIVHDGATFKGIDSGKVWNSTANAGGTVTYDATYSSVQLLSLSSGDGFWMAVWARALTEREILSLEQNPWQLFAPEARRVLFGASAGGGTSDAAITAAEGTATASTLTGSATDATAPTAAAGGATAASLVATATAQSAITAASGSATASALAGSSLVAASIVEADGVASAATLASGGSVIAAITPADGVATTSTLTGSSTSDAADILAAASAVAATLVGGSVAAASLVPAEGVASASTLSSDPGAAALVSAQGQATSGTLQGAATVAASLQSAAGQATASALAGGVAGVPDLPLAAVQGQVPNYTSLARGRRTQDGTRGVRSQRDKRGKNVQRSRR